MRRLAFLAAFLFAGVLPAADLTQSPAAIVRAPAVGTWTVIDQGLAIVATVPLDAGRSILLAQPGRYRVLWAAGGQTATTLVHVSGATPVPPGPGPKPIDPPSPQPQPIPAPVPAPQALAFVVVVEDPTDPATDVEIADIRLSAASGEIADWAKTAGVTVRVVSSSVTGPGGKPPAKLAPFLAAAEGRKLPWLVATGKPDESGDAAVVLSVRCPADVAGVLTLLRGAK